MSVPFHNGLPVPAEILENVAFELVAATPLGNPSQLVPLLLTSKAVNAALSWRSNHTLYARICRLKFDVAAVARRAFTPSFQDLTSHLVNLCNALRVIRSGDIDHEDADRELVYIYVAMLDNDGKNRAQLEHAGIIPFLERYVRAKLYRGRETNDMWPQDHIFNSCALNLMWMFMTRQTIASQTPQQRAELAALLFPYLVNPHRYPVSFAPPNHFSFPLGMDNPVQQDILTFQHPHGPFPIYQTVRHRPELVSYFRSPIQIATPLATPAAHMIFWALRTALNGYLQVPDELPAFRDPPDAPGLTQEDIREYNRHENPKLPPAVRWDWDLGYPVCTAGDGSARQWHGSYSKRWDIEWWRIRGCLSVFYKQPSFRIGPPYMRGLLDGIWSGVFFHENMVAFNEMVRNSQFPSNLNEETAMYMARPIFFRLKEHGFVATPAIHDAVPIQQALPSSMEIQEAVDGAPQRRAVPIDVGIKNAWFPGPIGGVQWVENCAPLDPGVLEDRFLASTSRKDGMPTAKFIVSNQPGPATEAGGPIEEPRYQPPGTTIHQYETYDPTKVPVHQKLTEAKDNLAIPVSPPSADPSPSSVSTRDPPQRHPGCRRCAEREAFLQMLKDREASRRVEQEAVDRIFSSIGIPKEVDDVYLGDPVDIFTAEDRARLETFEVRVGGDEESEELDAHHEHEHGPHGSTAEPLMSTPPSPEASSVAGSVSDDDDALDPGAGEPDQTNSPEPLRQLRDRYRVEECDDGIEDVVVTGDMLPRHMLAWGGSSVYYGRVRPWDGMVAILRVLKGPNVMSDSHMLFYGYVYGGETLVGNWRYAAGDPMIPGFEAGFIMSKRPE